jgi:hypothetical protein
MPDNTTSTSASTTTGTATSTATTADLPEMPAPRVREFPAHSIGGGLALLLGLLGIAGGSATFTPVAATAAPAVMHARVEAAGVHIIESRFTHLAYAPEIASAMLQRQQAGAVVAAQPVLTGTLYH